jgi:hypothetical protein
LRHLVAYVYTCKLNFWIVVGKVGVSVLVLQD